MSKQWSGGSTRGWRKIRARVLANNLAPPAQGGNDGRCTLQIPGKCTGLATQVHHMLGRGVTGDDIRYLQAVCWPCNRHVGDPTKHNPQPKKITKW